MNRDAIFDFESSEMDDLSSPVNRKRYLSNECLTNPKRPSTVTTRSQTPNNIVPKMNSHTLKIGKLFSDYKTLLDIPKGKIKMFESLKKNIIAILNDSIDKNLIVNEPEILVSEIYKNVDDKLKHFTNGLNNKFDLVLEKMTEKLDQRVNSNKSNQELSNTIDVRTFAEVVNMNKNNENNQNVLSVDKINDPPKNVPSGGHVIIRDLSENPITGKSILQKIKECVNPKEIGIKIAGINAMSEGKVVIHVNSKEDQTKLITKLKSSENSSLSELKISEKTTLEPRIILRN